MEGKRFVLNVCSESKVAVGNTWCCVVSMIEGLMAKLRGTISDNWSEEIADWEITCADVVIGVRAVL